MTTMYGLPSDVRFCKTCVISNQRPSSCIEYQHTAQSVKQTIRFDADGICSACRAVEQQHTIDWKDRDRQLRELCDKHRSRDGSYDCLVPGSGGKDSFMQANLLKYEYGMSPLTITWAPNIYTDIGRQNHRAWIDSGFDNYLLTPNGRTHRLLTRLAVENLFHFFQPFALGQKIMAPREAIRHGIKLVFYGESESLYGNPTADLTTAQRSYDYFATSSPDDVHLGGVSVGELIGKYGVTTNDLISYLPDDPDRLRGHGIEVHYLGWYRQWHPQGAFYYASERGFSCAPERTPGTYSKYNSLDDAIDDFHYWSTFIKYGIGRATYDAAQEIRNGDITREEGVALVRKFDGEWPERYARKVIEHLSINEREFPIASKCFERPIMTKESLLDLADKFRSPHLWTKYDGQWQLRHTVYE